MEKEVGIHFGFMVPKLNKQLKQFKLKKEFVRLQQLNCDYVNALMIQSILSENEVVKARKRILKIISREIIKGLKKCKKKVK